jgi:hypothetical protein
MLRRLLLVALVFAGLCSISSCVKSYTCHCDFKYTGAPGLPDSSYNEYDIKDTKSSAKSKCENQSGTFDNNGIHTVETCELH